MYKNQAEECPVGFSVSGLDFPQQVIMMDDGDEKLTEGSINYFFLLLIFTKMLPVHKAFKTMS